LDEITLHSVQQFLTSLRNKGYAASTCNHPIRVLRHAVGLACKFQIIESNQLAGVSLLREENQVNNIMTDDELKRLVKVLKSDKNKMVSSVCLSLLSTGVRLNEALSARWEHFDLEHHNWTIPSAHSKSRKIRSIRLNPTAIQILESLDTQDKFAHPFIGRRGKRLTTINRVWDRLRRDAGLPHLRLHDLRHNMSSTPRCRSRRRSVRRRETGARGWGKDARLRPGVSPSQAVSVAVMPWPWIGTPPRRPPLYCELSGSRRWGFPGSPTGRAQGKENGGCPSGSGRSAVSGHPSSLQ
jgi:integrase